MKHNRNRRYFRFMNARTGKSMCYPNGLTVNEHMKLMKVVNDWMDKQNQEQ